MGGGGGGGTRTDRTSEAPSRSRPFSPDTTCAATYPLSSSMNATTDATSHRPQFAAKPRSQPRQSHNTTQHKATARTHTHMSCCLTRIRRTTTPTVHPSYTQAHTHTAIHKLVLLTLSHSRMRAHTWSTHKHRYTCAHFQTHSIAQQPPLCTPLRPPCKQNIEQLVTLLSPPILTHSQPTPHSPPTPGAYTASQTIPSHP